MGLLRASRRDAALCGHETEILTRPWQTATGVGEHNSSGQHSEDLADKREAERSL